MSLCLHCRKYVFYWVALRLSVENSVLWLLFISSIMIIKVSFSLEKGPFDIIMLFLLFCSYHLLPASASTCAFWRRHFRIFDFQRLFPLQRSLVERERSCRRSSKSRAPCRTFTAFLLICIFSRWFTLPNLCNGYFILKKIFSTRFVNLERTILCRLLFSILYFHSTGFSTGLPYRFL